MSQLALLVLIQSRTFSHYLPCLFTASSLTRWLDHRVLFTCATCIPDPRSGILRSIVFWDTQLLKIPFIRQVKSFGVFFRLVVPWAKLTIEQRRARSHV